MTRKSKNDVYATILGVAIYGIWILCSWFFTWAVPWKWIDFLLTVIALPVLMYVWFILYMRYFKI